MPVAVRVERPAERRARLTLIAPAPAPKPFADAARARRVEVALQDLAASLVQPGQRPSERATVLASEYAKRPGKRVRPYLVSLGWELASGSGAAPEGVARFAAGLELLHAFLLVHDDIADRAETRRGEPALHVQLRPAPSALHTEGDRRRIGNDLGVVAGDFLYTASLQAMLGAPGLDPARVAAALGEVLAVCRETALGQYDDIAYAVRPLAEITPDDVLEVHRRKTARYTFEAPLVAGARLAGADEATVEALRRYSRAAGIAFQIEDDLLSLFSPEEETGKPNLADLREGKKTWPVVAAYRGATADERVWLEELFVRGDASVRDLARLTQLVRRTGALAAARNLVEAYVREAEAALEAVAPSEPARELGAIAHWLGARLEVVQ